MAKTSDVGSQPRYRRIADQIAADIRTGVFQQHLPPQDELAARYHIGRSTVREALRVLDEQRVIRVRHGVNTAILDTPPQITVAPGLESFVGVSQLIERAGFVPGTSDLQVRLATGSAYFSPAFTGKRVIVCERVRTANDIPVVFTIDVFADPGLPLEDIEAELRHGSLLAFLQRQGLAVTYAEADIHALPADSMVSERIGLPVGSPVLFIEEVVRDTAGQIVLCSHDYYHPQHFSFRVIRRAQRDQE